jgi:hypothetical protein
MRVLAGILVVFFALSAGSLAEAKKKKHPQKKAHAQVAVKVKPSSPQAAEDYQKAEAQLAELRTTRELPVTTLNNQDSDGEIPGQRATSK